MSFDSPAKHQRVERHLMRQRGAGVRTVSSNFGFSIGLNSATTSNDTTPTTREPPPTRRKTIVEHSVRKGGASTVEVVLPKPGRTRKRFVLEEEEKVNRGGEDDSFVFGQSKKRKGRHMESADAVVVLEMQTERAPNDVQDRANAATTETLTAVDMPANSTERRQRGQRKGKISKKSSKSALEKDQPHTQSMPLDQNKRAVTRKTRAKGTPQSRGEADNTNILLPSDGQAAATYQPAVGQPPARRSKKMVNHKQSHDLDHLDQEFGPVKSLDGLRGTRVCSVTTARDREERPFNPARPTRRVNAVKAKDVTDVIHVSRTDILEDRSVASLIDLKQQNGRHPERAKRRAGAAPSCRSELNSAIAVGQRNPLDLVDPAERTADGTACDTENGHARMTKSFPLAEIDANRAVYPEKPVTSCPHLFTRTHLNVSNNCALSSPRCSSPAHAEKTPRNFRKGESHRSGVLSRESVDPSESKSPYRDQQQSIAKVHTKTAAKVDAADAQIHAQNNNALTRIADPACRSRHQRYGGKNDHRSMKCGPSSTKSVFSEPDDSNTRANVSNLVSTSFDEHPPQHTDAHESRKQRVRRDDAVVTSNDDEDVDWLAEPAEPARQWSRQRNNVGPSGIKRNQRSHSRTKMLDIDLDDLISNIATFAQGGELEGRATARPRSKSSRKA